MGLLSKIKQSYYNYKLKKAIELVRNKSYNEAEVIFNELIPNHPEAVTNLAKIYFLQATDQNKALYFYQIALSCNSKLLNGVSNTKSFNDLKSDVLNNIYQHFKNENSKKNYKKALEFSHTLKQYNSDNNFLKEHYQCLFDLAVSTANKESKESEAILIQIYNECKSYSFLAEIIESTKEIIFNSAYKYSTLKEYDSSNSLCLIIIEDKLEAKYLFIENNINNLESVKKHNNEVSKLIDVVKTLSDKSIAVKYIEQLLIDIPSTTLIYGLYITEIANSLINKKNYNDAINLLNDALRNSNDSNFIEQLIVIAKKIIYEKDYNSAVILLSDLISKHPDTEPLLSECYLELSYVETANDSKKALLLKAFEFKSKHSNLFNSKLYEDIFKKIVIGLIEISYKYGEFSYFSDAYLLLDKVLAYQPLSINTFIKVKILEINSISATEKQIKMYKEAIEAVKQKITDINDIKNIQFDILYAELINATLKKYSHSDLDTSIHGLLEIKKEVVKNKIQSVILEQSIYKLDVEIVERYYNKGIELEIQNLYEEALYCFEIIINQYTTISDIFNQSLVRKHIILLKNNSIPKTSNFNDVIINILESQKRNKLIIDLAHRFSVHLIKSEFYDLAIIIIETYLPSKSNQVKILLELCQNEKIRKSKSLLSHINLQIKNINEENLTVKEAIEMLSNLEEFETQCTVLHDITGEIIGIKQFLISYIIYKSFQNENYTECFNYIKKYNEDYINDNIAFRNIAIASLGIIAKGGMNKENFKELISIWLTAIFNDKLFIYSLNYTTWDDNFTFSLQNSLGCLLDEDTEIVPDNINYDDVNEANISIGDVQKSLLESIEKMISTDLYKEDIKTISLEFLSSEIDAITSFYRLELDSKILGCTPYFAQHKNEFRLRIKDSLIDELRFSDINKENVLKVGLLYNIESAEFKNYSDSILLKNKAVIVVKNKNNSQTKLIFTKQNVDKVRKYEELFTGLCNELRDTFKELIKVEDNFESIIANFLIVCNAMSDANLNYLVSNSANRICVSKLNEESINKEKGLKILSDVFDIIKDNDKLNENLQAVMNSAVIDIITEGDRVLTDVFYKTIDKSINVFDKGIIDTLDQAIEIIVLSGKRTEFISFSNNFNKKTNLKTSLNRIIIKANEMQINLDLSIIVDKLNSRSISELQGLKLTYELYKTDKNHKRVCENLVILCGNLIHSNVISKTTSTSQITNILDELNRNKSAVFIQCAIELSNQRIQILNSLPYDVKHLIIGTSLLGSTLTPEGEALKKGLNYLKQLSN